MRIGNGYDVHRLSAGRRLVLAGVSVPFELGLLGHSDADVLAHAIIDSLLGAAALGDIGRYFPPEDARWKDADSMEMLESVGQMLAQKGCRIVNIDSVLIAQRPRVAEYIPQMRANIARALGTEIDAISVKATTEEGLGFTGAGQGIAAHAVCLIDT